jgi:alpha-tubulin suppressor-like RCC1 family protein
LVHYKTHQNYYRNQSDPPQQNATLLFFASNLPIKPLEQVAPSDNGYTKIYSTATAFAALKADGSITAWGQSDRGGTGAPSDNGYTKIYSNEAAFAALKADGSITAWGHSDRGGTGAPVRLCLPDPTDPTP